MTGHHLSNLMVPQVLNLENIGPGSPSPGAAIPGDPSIGGHLLLQEVLAQTNLEVQLVFGSDPFGAPGGPGGFIQILLADLEVQVVLVQILLADLEVRWDWSRPFGGPGDMMLGGLVQILLADLESLLVYQCLDLSILF